MANNYSTSSHLKAFGIGVVIAIAGIAGYLWWTTAQATPAIADTNLPTITVYKSPTCGCCKEWVAHLQEQGFTVQTADTTAMQAVKQRYGVPRGLRSCHTAVVGDYVVEGHVPARDIKQMLAQQPKIAGLSVPGMPVGSPGMEQGGREQAYNVVAFAKDGRSAVYARYNQ